MAMTPDATIDLSRRFMPEHLTPLYHTAVYAQLPTEVRRRYNQLHASYLNEQTIFFESEMAQHILWSFVHGALPAELKAGLASFRVEEARHSEMFRALNRRCRPHAYADRDFDFIRLSPLTSGCLRMWVRRARAFPLFLWLLLIQEERALFYAKAFLREADTLEPAFVETQRRHLTDEVGHVRWDEQLLECVWPGASATWRRLNARLFTWLLGEFFTTPKRSGWRVVAVLLHEFPSLRPLEKQLRAALFALAHHREFQQLAYSREVTPRAFARFDRWPEFHRLRAVLPCYQPLPVGITAAEGLAAESSSAR